jgi:exodeoxyribonuclease V alpha subunit
VSFVPAASPAQLAAVVDAWYEAQLRAWPELPRLADKVYRWADGELAAGDRDDVAALFACYESARLLTVTRSHVSGAVAINRRLHARVLAGATTARRPEFYPGEPILVRDNDYRRGLFNGDQGVILRVSERGAGHHFRAVFVRDGAFRMFHLDSLRHGIELAFAMTVHKSQGSEFDHVALLLPPVDLPLVTRELLYTAVSRARRSVAIAGPETVLRRGVARQAVRYSGIPGRLA